MSKYLLLTVVSVLLSSCDSSAPPSSSSNVTSSVIVDQHVHQQCPPWFWSVSSREQCQCGPDTNGVQCFQAENKSRLHRLHCMSYNDETDSTTVGYCPYRDLQAEHAEYTVLPNNRSQLNKAICGKAHREGLLCSMCEPGYGPSPLTYDHRCAKCSNSYFGWLLYFCAALIPTTVFFLLIVLCQVRTTSAPLNLFVFACQLISLIQTVFPQKPSYINLSETTTIIYGIAVTLLTSWNLDFFRFLIPPFCVSEKLSNFQVLSMDYIVAFYPLLLTVVMYICIQQHARGCRPLVCLWKPFGFIIDPLTKQLNWNPATSIVPMFASFLLLSSTKILTVSFILLHSGQPVTNMSSTGTITVQGNLLYYDPNMTFLSQGHLPYAVLAIFVSSTFILPCLVLILYPMRLFQKFLNWCGIGSHAVHAFADAFNGCYKNGNNHTRDYRSFAGFYLLVRILMFADRVGPFTHSSIIKLLSISFVFIFAIASPYRSRFFNVADSLGLTLLAFRVCINEYKGLLNAIAGVWITLYFVVLVSCAIIFKLNCCCSRKLKALADQMSGIRRDIQHTERQEEADNLPDRMVNPDGYSLLTEVDGQPQSFSDIPTYGSTV